MDKERTRTEIEKFSSSKLSLLWHFPAYLLSILATGAYLIYAFFSKDFSWLISIGLAIPAGLGTYIFSMEEDWDKRLERKWRIYAEKIGIQDYELDESDVFSPYNKYAPKRFYTDSALEYYAFVLSKTLLTILTIPLFLGLIFLGFMWLGAISIAPTTVIIILLLIIIFNQTRRDD